MVSTVGVFFDKLIHPSVNTRCEAAGLLVAMCYVARLEAGTTVKEIGNSEKVSAV